MASIRMHGWNAFTRQSAKLERAAVDARQIVFRLSPRYFVCQHHLDRYLEYRQNWYLKCDVLGKVGQHNFWAENRGAQERRRNGPGEEVASTCTRSRKQILAWMLSLGKMATKISAMIGVGCLNRPPWPSLLGPRAQKRGNRKARQRRWLLHHLGAFILV